MHPVEQIKPRSVLYKPPFSAIHPKIFKFAANSGQSVTPLAPKNSSNGILRYKIDKGRLHIMITHRYGSNCHCFNLFRSFTAIPKSNINREKLYSYFELNKHPVEQIKPRYMVYDPPLSAIYANSGQSLTPEDPKADIRGSNGILRYKIDIGRLPIVTTQFANDRVRQMIDRESMTTGGLADKRVLSVPDRISNMSATL